MKGAEAHVDKAKLFEQICLEQFYSTIREKLKGWILDQQDVGTLQKAADYADEYYGKRFP